MPRSDTRIRNPKPSEKPIKLPERGGLYLEARPSGAKLWRDRYRIAGKEYVLDEAKVRRYIRHREETERWPEEFDLDN